MTRCWLSLAIVFSVVLVAAGSLLAQTETTHGVEGEWREPGGSVIRVAPCGQNVCATLIRISSSAPSQVDGKNPDPALRSRALCGLQIGYGFHLNDAEDASDGKLYDPKSGKTYSGTMKSAGDVLNLRGYVGFRAFGRTESWTRVHGVASCAR